MPEAKKTPRVVVHRIGGSPLEVNREGKRARLRKGGREKDLSRVR